MDFDTHLYENANFLRLKSLQAAYALPKKALGKQNVLNGLRTKAVRAAINDLVDSLGPWADVLVDAFAIP